MSDPTPTLPASARVGLATLTPVGVAWLVGLLGWSLLVGFYDLDGGAGFEPTDCWVAQTAREMYEANEWIVPVFSSEVRMQKSPGPYWAVMVAAWLRGGAVDEVSARIPSVLAGVLIVLTVFWLTLHIAGQRAAIYAGFACAASTLFLYWTHRAASDLGLAAFTTLSLAALWVATESPERGWKRNGLFLLGYFAAGLGMLYKMPMPLAVVGLPAFVYVLVRNRWRVFLHWIHLLGIVAFLLPWLPWVVAVSLRVDNALDKWRVEYFDRFTGDLPNVEGQSDWQFLFFYLIPTVVYAIPFMLSLPAAIGRSFRSMPGVRRDGQWFLLIWFIGLFVFFTASAGKETRYFLPALPPLFVLLGMELSRFFDPQRAPPLNMRRIGAIATWVLVPTSLAVGAYLLYDKWYDVVGKLQPRPNDPLEMLQAADVMVPYGIAAGILAVGCAVAALFFLQRRGNASFATLVGTMFAAWFWAWPTLFPIFVSQCEFKDFSQQLIERVPRADQRIMRQIAQQDPRIMWYSDYRFPRILDQLQLLEEQDGVRDLTYERRRIGEAIIEALRGEERALMVVSLLDFIEFDTVAPVAAAQQGESMPEYYVWLRSSVGRPDRHYLLISNQRPEWEPVTVEIPDKWRRRALDMATRLGLIEPPTSTNTGDA